MARKDAKEEYDYHGRGEMSITILVILPGSVESSKVSLSEKSPEKRTAQFGNGGSEGF